MELFVLVFCVIPTIVAPIRVSSNGNSPEIKMIGGMMVDVQKGFSPMAMQTAETATVSNYDVSKKLKLNSTELSINERYRRLIPYMTFYYANDLSSTTEADSTQTVEVEKAKIIEAKTLEPPTQRQQKKIIYAPNRNIPRYQGNRLTQFNLESANPTKIYYKEVPEYQQSLKVNHNLNPISSEPSFGVDHPEFNHGRFVQKQMYKSPTAVQPVPTRKPYLNFYNNEDQTNVQYYFSNKEPGQNFKLIPYVQTPPVKVSPYNENGYENKKPIPVAVFVHKEPVYIKSKPTRPHYVYENVQQVIPRKPIVVSESYYEKRRLNPPATPSFSAPVIESGFKPIINGVISTESPTYTTILPAISPIETVRKPTVQIVESLPLPVEPIKEYKPSYYQYVVEQPIKAEQYTPIAPSKQANLSDLLNSLQLNKSVPKPITRENVGSSIRTLLQVLNALKAMTQQNEVEPPLLTTPKPFVAQEVAVEMTPRTVVVSTPEPVADADLHEEPNLAHVNTPSQHLDGLNDEHPLPPGTTSQRFPPPVHSDDEGGTPGRPGVDYPTLTTIPHTSFNCKTQRYKGFFADPETRCQVWHYCDLNGGQASFLCPNGTIFSQAGLTCDWWFNVRCASTTQLYVLNESLYKFILPHSPKFPEDYSGPLVDKYLTLKFKEMEEQFRKNKNKQSATEKVDSLDDEFAREDPNATVEVETTSQRNEDSISHELGTVSEASVVVESPGTSGNVQRLED